MRYAIYYSPPKDDPLTCAANRWLGRSAFDGIKTSVAHSLGPLINSPARYGFHATLKAPFSLKTGCDRGELVESFYNFCKKQTAFSVPPLVLSQLGPYFALTLSEPSEELDQFAARAVETFEPFRAEPLEADIARRRPETLSARQREHLDLWGYPYVFDEFRFHMTLTGPVEDDQSTQVGAVLQDHFADHLGKPHAISSCALFVENSAGEPFQIDTFSRLGS